MKNFLFALALSGLILLNENLYADEQVATELINIHTTHMGVYSNPLSEEFPGFLTELLRRVVSSSGIRMEIRGVPWKRALIDIERDDSEGIIYPVLRTENREDKFKWLIHAVTDREVFFTKTGKPGVENLEEIKNARIGVVRGSPFEAKLQELKFPNIDSAVDAVSNARKLILGRVDYWFVTFNTGSSTFREISVGQDDVAVGYAIDETHVYIAANRSFSPELAARLQSAYLKVRESPWYNTLKDRYGVIDVRDTPIEVSPPVKQQPSTEGQ